MNSHELDFKPGPAMKVRHSGGYPNVPSVTRMPNAGGEQQRKTTAFTHHRRDEVDIDVYPVLTWVVDRTRVP